MGPFSAPPTSLFHRLTNDSPADNLALLGRQKIRRCTRDLRNVGRNASVPILCKPFLSFSFIIPLLHDKLIWHDSSLLSLAVFSLTFSSRILRSWQCVTFLTASFCLDLQLFFHEHELCCLFFKPVVFLIFTRRKCQLWVRHEVYVCTLNTSLLYNFLKENVFCAPVKVFSNNHWFVEIKSNGVTLKRLRDLLD